MKYCSNCGKRVVPVKRKFSWIAFFICFGVFYLPYRAVLPKNICPNCGDKV